MGNGRVKGKEITYARCLVILDVCGSDYLCAKAVFRVSMT